LLWPCGASQARGFHNEATAEIGSVLLHNSVNVMNDNARRLENSRIRFHASRNGPLIGALALVSVAPANVHYRERAPRRENMPWHLSSSTQDMYSARLE